MAAAWGVGGGAGTSTPSVGAAVGVTGPDAAEVPTGVELCTGAPTNVMLRGSRFWIGGRCSADIGTSDVVGQRGEKEGQSKAGPRTGLAGAGGALLPLSVHRVPLVAPAGPAAAEGWSPEGYPPNGSVGRTLGASDST